MQGQWQDFGKWHLYTYINRDIFCETVSPYLYNFFIHLLYGLGHTLITEMKVLTLADVLYYFHPLIYVLASAMHYHNSFVSVQSALLSLKVGFSITMPLLCDTRYRPGNGFFMVLYLIHISELRRSGNNSWEEDMSLLYIYHPGCCRFSQKQYNENLSDKVIHSEKVTYLTPL